MRRLALCLAAVAAVAGCTQPAAVHVDERIVEWETVTDADTGRSFRCFIVRAAGRRLGGLTSFCYETHSPVLDSGLPPGPSS